MKIRSFALAFVASLVYFYNAINEFGSLNSFHGIFTLLFGVPYFVSLVSILATKNEKVIRLYIPFFGYIFSVNAMILIWHRYSFSVGSNNYLLFSVWFDRIWFLSLPIMVVAQFLIYVYAFVRLKKKPK